MKFLVLLTEEDSFDRWDAATDVERAAMLGQLEAFSTAVAERGTLLAGEALQRPDRARTRRPGGVVTEGPFAETVEQVGGFYHVDLPDLDTAVDLVRLMPDAWTVEVRPVEPME
jgi:hypothetical protein